MGSRKKLSLKQAEKMQKRQAKKQSPTKKEGKQREGSSSPQKKSIGIISPNIKNEKTINEIKKMKVLTPYSVASRFDIRLSVARIFLEELKQKGIIQYVSAGKNIKIYKPSD